MKKNDIIRMAIIVGGQVQGVGFRPFVWRMATRENLTGSVRNTSAGVRIEIQGPAASLEAFERHLTGELPPLARIASLSKEAVKPVEGEAGFEIAESQGHAGQNVLVSADVATCAECLAEMRDPHNRRFGYAFTNCVNCGPRFTITRTIPYDRPTTTMACFRLCESCEREYTSPQDRRFHAQPVACAACGPELWFAGKDDPGGKDAARNDQDALEKAGELILSGGILALKGLGGFQLACDARHSGAVAALRARKNRPHKALAVMTASLDSAARFCDISPEARKILEGPKKPITLCRKPPFATAPLVDAIAPDTDSIGVMLPYTPLHALLFDWLEANGLADPTLVMTSANARDEPICLGNREAISRLRDLADGWLLHNRDILARVDDSVVDARAQEASSAPGPVFIRRARGYVPEPIALSIAPDSPTALGAGAELKSTFCITRGDRAFLSQHIGDLKNLPTLGFYRQALDHLKRLLETEPAIIVHDLHPDYISTQFAIELAERESIPRMGLQHHAAHAMAALAGEDTDEPALALCLDGAGLGDDGTIWGGELLLLDLAAPSWKRLGRIAPFPLPGGDMAVLHPWRLARALQWQNSKFSPVPGVDESDIRIIDEMLERGLNCPLTSSCGRLFDAVSASLGLCQSITYEGQAAIRLEKAAGEWLASHKGKMPEDLWELPLKRDNGLLELDGALAIQPIGKDLAEGHDAGLVAAVFHASLADALAKMAKCAADSHNVRKVALCGGVLQNRIFGTRLSRRLREHGLLPVLNPQIPPGDGGLSLGQALWGVRMSRAGETGA